MRKKIDVSKLPPQPMTGYQAAKSLGLSGNDPNVAGEVATAMRKAGWTFHEYDWNGDDVLKPPAYNVELCPHCGGSGMNDNGTAWCLYCDGQQGYPKRAR